jgi:hypothetical protein
VSCNRPDAVIEVVRDGVRVVLLGVLGLLLLVLLLLGLPLGHLRGGGLLGGDLGAEERPGRYK